MSLDGTYAFEIGEPGDRIDIRIELARQGVRAFISHLRLERMPWTDRTLARLLVTRPLMPWLVTAAIHRQAFALWRKRLRYHPKPPYDPLAARGGPA
jgi:hypothetical protein